MQTHWIATWLLLAWLMPAEAAAQAMTVRLGAAAGTGLELAGGGGTAVRRSPTFVTVQAGVLLDNETRFELGAALLMELEGRVGLAVEPQLRVNTPGRRWRGYFVAGTPIFVSPYTLFGVSVGPGMSFQLWRALLLFSELALRVYPFGNDLPEGVVLFHADLSLGVRYAF
ncbi:MAG: hypothetical protein RMK29_16780 [Myxococcales bacterium]|nr:hypothetical protein [Myxococcota bacterium]MDW8283364.1 hypothetical protein [Myxococcales bacterium]